MDLIEKKIIEALPATPGTSFDFKGVYVDPDNVSHNVTVFDTEYFITNVIQLYRNRKIIIDKDQEGYLAGLFRIWKSLRENLYLKQAYAYTLKYNPTIIKQPTKPPTAPSKVFLGLTLQKGVLPKKRPTK